MDNQNKDDQATQTDAEFLTALGILGDGVIDPDPPPELSESENSDLSHFLELVSDEDIERYKYRARKFGVAQTILEILHNLQRKNEHDTVIGLTEMLLRQFEHADRPHVCKLNVSMSIRDINDSDIWYSLWEALIQFVRWHKRQPHLPDKITEPLKKSEIGYRFVRQILRPNEPIDDEAPSIDSDEGKEHSKIKPGDQNDGK